MSANINLKTGIRYGVISCNSLNQDLVQELFYTHGVDLSYAAAVEELRREIECEADDIEETAREEAENYAEGMGFSAEDSEAEVEAKIEAAYVRLGYSDREDYIETRMQRESEHINIAEPVIEGTYEGVKYRIDWLGGSPLLWVIEGPVGYCDRLCSPCVPNAGDLDSGITYDTHLPAGCRPERDAFECYVVPRDWLREKHE